jgi:phosphatidylinositol-4-phosphate 3-kinase
VGTIKGGLKLTVEYRRDVLNVMVCHAKNLAIPDGSKDEPNSYVKVYMRPDPHKATKRKTRVVRKNCHPSFMEMVKTIGRIIFPLDRAVVMMMMMTLFFCLQFTQQNI